MSETVHATAVLAGAHGVLIRGPSGSGKSTFAFAMIERGARLVADDRVHLSACHGRLLATAHGAISGKLELRGRGLVDVPHERSAIIRLVVDLVDEAALERLPADDQMTDSILGVSLPRQPAPAASGGAMLLVSAALHSLSPGRNMGLRRA
jgi:serine kinase of HPr protein (carbohydrate metabolism regulator)